MIEVAVRKHVVNDSALPQLETMQMKYRVMHCVEAIYGMVSKGIRLKPLYKSTACGTVCCTTSTQTSSRYHGEQSGGSNTQLLFVSHNC